MSMNPKVSILVPIYGVEKFIERCAISLFEQTFEDIEFIFVNDCTPDGSMEVLKGIISLYPNREHQIKIIEHVTNKGLAGARNTGVDNASGEYILHVDSDDYLELDAIGLLYNAAIDQNADIVVFDFFIEWKKTRIEIKPIFRNNCKFDFLNDILRGISPTCVWNKFIKRIVYTDNNIKAIEGVDYAEDYSVIPKVIFNSNLIYKLDRTLYHYIQSNGDAYTKKFSEKSKDSLLNAIEINEKFFSENKNTTSYTDSLNIFKLKRKLELYEKMPRIYWKELEELFVYIEKNKYKKELNVHEKIIFNLLYNIKSLFLLNVYLVIYKKAFLLKQLLNNRL